MMPEIKDTVRNLCDYTGLERHKLVAYLGQDIFKIDDSAVSTDILDAISILFCLPVSAILSGEFKTASMNFNKSPEALSVEDLYSLAEINRIILSVREMSQMPKR